MNPLNMRSLSLAISLALALVTPVNGESAPAKAKIESLASVEGITEYKLSNGLRVLLFPDASKPTTTVNITYLVGSMRENYGETGMAHLLEHLVFRIRRPTKTLLPNSNAAALVLMAPPISIALIISAPLPPMPRNSNSC